MHVRRDKQEAKFWIDPLVELADNHGFASHELNEIGKVVESHREFLLESWRAYIGEDGNHP